ncbi:MAG: hypothetical protein PVF56_17465 [Desulfobacterales bacterium]
MTIQYCHPGLDPWFDRLTTLSKVEGESIAIASPYFTWMPGQARHDIVETKISGNYNTIF